MKTILVSFLILTTLQIPYAATYWDKGIRSNPISVCFVGNAPKERPKRVNEILATIEQFQKVANIYFKYLGSCPPPTTRPDGTDYYEGDIRVVIPKTSISGTGPVPGKGCPMFRVSPNSHYNGKNDKWGSWTNPPNELDLHRSCLYNLKLGDDPWDGNPYLNHTLHEFGHALGLIHEHERKDAYCFNPASDARWKETGYLTPYDRHSVMHYKFSKVHGQTCDVKGNYGHTGLSDLDMLSLQILYPFEGQMSQIVGNTTIKNGQNLNLRLALEDRGAFVDHVLRKISWQLGGSVESTTTRLQKRMDNVGVYSLKMIYIDLIGRQHTYNGFVQVVR